MQRFTIASTVRLNSGFLLPRLGLGVYSRRNEDAAAIRKKAFQVGFRCIDASASAFNLTQWADALAMSDTLERSDVFFMTKIPPSTHQVGYQDEFRSVGSYPDREHYSYKSTLRLVDAAVKNTRSPYLDLAMIANPDGGFATHRGTWRALVESVDEGKVRSLGVCDYDLMHLEELEDYTRELGAERGGAPGAGGVLSVAQWVLHPWNRRPDVVTWCRRRGVAVQAYCPRVKDDYKLDGRLSKLTSKYNKTDDQIVLNWILQSGYCPMVRTGLLPELLQYADLFDFEMRVGEAASLGSPYKL